MVSFILYFFFKWTRQTTSNLETFNTKFSLGENMKKKNRDEPIMKNKQVHILI